MAQSKKQVQVTETKQVNVFRVIKNNDKFVIICGNARISQQEFNTLNDAVKYINSKPWELIINACLYIQELKSKEETK